MATAQQSPSANNQEAIRLASALAVLRNIAATRHASDEGEEDLSNDDAVSRLYDTVETARAELGNHEPGNGLFPVFLDAQELNTILAALRFYQEEEMTEPDNRSDAIHDIATNGDQETSMDDAGVDELCEKLNFAMAA